MKTYKEKTIDAIKLLIKKYEILRNLNIFSMAKSEVIDKIVKSGHKDLFLVRSSFGLYYNPSPLCPLCKIYARNQNNCKGCVLARKNGEPACQDSGYYEKIKNKRRIRFWKTVLPIIEKIDKKYFTPSKWNYKKFETIYRLQNQIMNGS